MRGCQFFIVVLINLLPIGAESNLIATSVRENEYVSAIMAFKHWSQLNVDEHLEQYRSNRLAITQCLLAAIAKNPRENINPVAVEHYYTNGRIRISHLRERRLNQMELICLARKYIDNGADVSKVLLDDYWATDNYGEMVLLEKGETAPLIALKLGYELLAYDLLSYANTNNLIYEQTRMTAVEYAEKHNATRFLHLMEETDHGMINRMLNDK